MQAPQETKQGEAWPPLTEAERQKVLYDWNQTDTPEPYGGCLHELFAEQVARTPDAVAVYYEGQTLTYRELDERANRLARYLIKRGTGPERMVGICTERSLEMMVGIIGILKAGGAYVPIDPNYPLERLSYIIADSGIDHLLTQAHLQAKLAQASSVQLLPLDERWTEIAQESSEPVDSGTTPENLAYVIYTSGSTGQPKGVMIEHRNIINFTMHSIREFQAGPDTRMVQLAAFSFDASAFEFFTALLSGGRICLAPRLRLMPGPDFVQFAQETQITHALITPAVLRLMKPEDFPSLQMILCGGEVLNADLVEKWSPGRRLYNGYGPTEVTVIVTIERTTDPHRQPPIGRPIDNSQAYILGPDLEPLPVGATGELYIGGAGVSRGYWNRPDMTAERYLPNPFRSGERIYKTGDLARWAPEGTVEYVGRIDDQVKIRGFRIELAEVTSAVVACDGVEDAVVVCREDSTGDKRLVAYAVLQAGLEPSGVRAQLQARLPDFMVPSVVVPIDEIPLTPNGKADARALTALASSLTMTGAQSEAEEQERQDPTVQKLLAIWEAEFGSPINSIHDDFFDIGGHSLLAMRIFTKMHESFGNLLTIQEFFDEPKIAMLAAKLNSRMMQDLDSMSEEEIERLLMLMEAEQNGGTN